MKHLISIAVLFLLTLHSVLPTYASSKEQVEWQGYLIDRKCKKAIEGTDNALDFIVHHTKDCALLPSCKEAGFALYLSKEKKWLLLDKTGNDLAIKTIERSKKDSGYFVSIKGKLLKGIVYTRQMNEVKTNDQDDTALQNAR